MSTQEIPCDFSPVHSTRERAGLLLQGAVVAVVLIAGLLKLISIDDFRNSLDTWQLIPRSLRNVVAIGVPAIEILCAGWWFVGGQKRWTSWTCLSLLAAFTGFYAAHVYFLRPPTCNCFSKILAFNQERASSNMIITRNLTLFGLLGLGVYLRRGSATSRMSPARREQSAGRSSLASGFTIIELLLVIAIIGVLLAMFVPNLGYFRQRAQRTSMTARLQQHAAVFSTYTSDYKDFWPFFTDPEASYSIVRGPGLTLKARYFDADSTWHVALGEKTYGQHWGNPVFWDFNQKSPSFVTNLRYSSAFLADPAFWSAETRTGPAQWRATKAAEVQFPSAKALMVSLGSFGTSGMSVDLTHSTSVLSSFVDGSATEVPLAQMTPGYPRGNGDWPGSSLSGPVPGLTTVDGVRGRDRQ
ncbi:MAG: type II secretion system protein [Phycisphaerales bacterium]